MPISGPASWLLGRMCVESAESTPSPVKLTIHLVGEAFEGFDLTLVGFRKTQVAFLRRRVIAPVSTILNWICNLLDGGVHLSR